MKANRKFKSFTQDTGGYQKIIAALVALLLTILIGIMVYWEVSESIDMTADTVETFTGYSASANATAWTVDLEEHPTGTSATNVTCYNSTSKNESYPAFTLSSRTISVAGDAADEFSQVNVTYTSTGAEAADGVDSMSSTVFDLLPLIALVVIAGIILAIVLGFGGDGKGKNGGL